MIATRFLLLVIDLLDDSDKFHIEKNQGSLDSATGSQASRLDIQSAINVQILTQLDNLGKRLEKIEGKMCKKTSD